jgi:energy-converting hydrogenase Eha subunit A
MAVSPEDIAAGTLALQVFVKNARNVEIIVGVAFAVIPTVLGIGAAGLLGSGIINTAKEIRNSVSLLKTFGTGILYGGYGLNVLREKFGGKWQQSNNWLAKGVGTILAPDLLVKSRLKKNQDTQGKQEEQGSGGGGGNPPTPPDTKSDKKEEQKKE